MKLNFINYLALLLVSISCNTKENNTDNPLVPNSPQNIEAPVVDDSQEQEIDINNNFDEEINEQTSECIFETDNDVQQFLIGKTFREKGGSTYITFSYDGANLSGLRDYQWLSYQSLGGFKGVVKLASTSMDNPDGVLTLWVSCRENAVTDGNLVLLN